MRVESDNYTAFNAHIERVDWNEHKFAYISKQYSHKMQSLHGIYTRVYASTTRVGRNDG